MSRLRQASDVVRFVLYISLAIAVIAAAVHLHIPEQTEAIHAN
jgi:hypothetical protein